MQLVRGGARPLLMVVTDRSLARLERLPDVVAAAVGGGADLVQVREKDLPDGLLLELVLAIRERVGRRARVVVNGRPAVARAAGVGLHLPEAAPASGPEEGPWPLVGRSVHGPGTAAGAAAQGVDYLVAGPLFATPSKPGAPPLGVEGLRAMVRAAAAVPVLAIGGITADRVGTALKAGAAGVAVRGAVMGAPDPEAAARALRRALDDEAAPLRASP